ncbi:ABC transporter substrate-binding protein [Staphylococcus cohnii]|uniref:metal ABC transporter solute-binding protein, Zn/Mn family n=1 Tax=Staphylococcus ureilyticus TaxID=94138 RepID=UPI000D1C6D05|nr:zinc ABC transporter substrate-binding protein [Staphylococcus ureilyticus]MBM9448497.1 zinc ABC transporter substrate-binding protein [Staphylococcus ureilyticus]PTF41941.1 ABC transporter substrate-binding protein [Staphylococcus cohnii]PTF44974.1 ABC transporter substrate-binding protein [Staphylococcus cohnii]
MLKKGLVILFSGVLTVSLVGCNNSEDNGGKSKDSKDKLEVKTTVYPLKSFTEQIGGKYVDVKSVYPNGMDPHTYDPSQKEMINIGKSDLFVYTGDDLDPVAKKISSAVNDKDKTLSLESSLNKDKDLLKGEEHEHEHEHEEEDHHGHEHHHHGEYDPHVWLDPVISQKFAEEIKDELVDKDSEHKDYYEKNYKKLNSDLKKIDKDMKHAVKGNKGETVYISHDSIGYLADRYGFKQEGVENMNAEEPSQKDLTNIAKQIKDDNVKYVLSEENVSSKVSDTVRKETDAKPLKFYNMGSHTKQQDDDNNSYQSFMKKNADTLEKALKNK